MALELYLQHLFFNTFAEKYFDMNKKHAREALDSYKKFLIRMDRVAEFLKVAEVSNSYSHLLRRGGKSI